MPRAPSIDDADEALVRFPDLADRPRRRVRAESVLRVLGWALPAVPILVVASATILPNDRLREWSPGVHAAWAATMASALSAVIVFHVARAAAGETARLQAARLRAEELESRGLAEAAFDGLALLDPAGRVKRPNEALLSLLGSTASQLVGRPLTDIAPPEFRQALTETIQAASGQVTDLRITDPQGGSRPVEIRISRTVGGLVMAIRDAAKIWETEAKLAVYRDIIAGAHDGVALLDGDGGYLEQNAAHFALLGLPDGESASRSPGTLLGQDIFDELLAAARRHGVARREVLLRNGWGGEIPVEATLFSTLRQGAHIPARYVLVLHDATERLEGERREKARIEALETSNRVLQQFAWVASHDLKEPLRMVGSYTQLLARRYRGRLDAEADEFIGYTVDGVRRMQALIDDLLAWVRVAAEVRPPEATNCELVLQRAMLEHQDLILETGAQISHSPLPTVAAERLELVRLFRDLIGNALRFRGASQPCIHLSAEQEEDGFWHFRLRDNGIGIAPEFHQRIFEIFQRLQPRSEDSGTGVGLAICRRIVECRGGRIWVESRPGDGATFHFTLPPASGSPPGEGA